MAGTRCINGRELRRLYEAKGARWTVEHLTEALERGHLKGSDFSIRELAENTVKNGSEWVRGMEPRRGGSYTLLEAGTVDYSAFSNITGQIFFNEIKQKYEGEEFIFSKLVPTKSSPLLDEEKIPGFGGIGNQFDTPLKEGDQYPYLSIAEDYITLPPKRKRGGIIAITKEAIAGDRTGQLLDYCQEIGWYLGYRKEVSIIDTMIDGNSAAASIRNGGTRYHWKDTSYSPYQATSPWINVKTSTALNDWTSVQSVELLFANMTNPFTGLPILLEPTHIIVPPDLRHTAQRIMTATNVQTHVGGYATSGNLQDYHAPSPLDPYKVVSSRVFKKRLNDASIASTTSWFMGNPGKALCYRDNWGITLEQMGAGTEDAFNRDVVHRIRVSERGTAGWLEPRLMAKVTA